MDEHFNAITGFNCSGKSNILDGICFLLRLTSFSRARVNLGNELIYKNGQAGIEQAQVTIVFANNDKRRSPIGFESSPTITITRMIKKDEGSKYFVNGHSESQSKVKDIFKSVGLNIDSSSFLVQQVNIAKIVNFNPKEILEHIEQTAETAGTSFYHQKKEETLKIISKKKEIVKEILSLLMDEVEPKMAKLNSDVLFYKN